ncbi:undecaprenyl-diphosphate phosphatase [Halopiger xanaduensis]|uniref:undecaprenyl-diphosphate phosphatase n=1 Tax=Halopiger xanaduensis TaxID=387343 RepID=UPI0011D2657C|nr:undecaprenyl-diphosphate phosphatase [Halopiger xanaduensis]
MSEPGTDQSDGENPSPNPRDLVDNSEDEIDERIIQNLQNIQENQELAQQERKHLRGKINRKMDGLERHVKKENDPTEFTAEDLYRSVVLATIFVGVVGMLISIIVSGYGFIPLFGIGIAFLIFAYKMGIPDEL